MPAPLELYRAALESGSHEPDPAQERAVVRLESLYQRLGDRGAKAPLPRRDSTTVGAAPSRRDRTTVGAAPSRRDRTTVGAAPSRRDTWMRRLRRTLPFLAPPEPVPGLYLWGTVGRGKTWLMDLFHESLPTPRKRRVHFHRFMRETHRELNRLRETRDPLEKVADRVARDVDVLCFDELHVSDIGDAMILGTLLSALFARGVTLVATSNQPPQELYRDGLQRARFLPAIAAIERHMEVFELGGETDFRLRALEQARLYHAPAGTEADARLQADFRRIAGHDGDPGVELEVEGRPVRARRCADGVAWFDFGEICDGPRSANDYIELARLFHTVFVSGVPGLDRTRENQARRFIALVDEFYDRNVKLVLSADAPLDGLYSGNRLRFEFQRTHSRLLEMQSHDYLGRPHLG